jgi:hypothetical protein
MARASIKLWFCLVAAVAAAAIADPIVEAASNAGWFGPGSFTDRSNADVVPAIALSLVFAGLYLASRVRQMPARIVAGSAVWKLLPLIYVLQIATLYVMESCEQYVVAGHLLGPFTWLGGPIAISLCAHAVACVLATFIVSRLLEILYGKTAQLVRLVRVLVTRTGLTNRATFVRVAGDVALHPSLCALCLLGERAPPFVTA